MTPLNSIKKSLLTLTIAHNTNNQSLALSSTKEIINQSSLLQNNYKYYKEKDQERNKYSLYNLVSGFQEEIESSLIEILESDYPCDELTKRADTWIPVYNWDLTQYLANDFSLAMVDDEGLIEGCTDIFKIIQMSIYEQLTSAAYEKLEELKDQKLDHWQYLADKAQNLICEIEEKQSEENEKDNDLYWDKAQKVIDNLTEKQAHYENLIDKLEEL